ncbi:MAG: hypothetical protein ABGY75_06670 [Gemmataceae bacterium]
MTGAAAMTEFTPTAEARLHDYLAQVRQALYAHPDVSPDEVEADVREHIDTEFARLTRPVTLSELETVLTRLGPPTQWAEAGANSVAGPRIEPFDWKAFAAGVRRRVLGVFATLWKGPEDWRLAYLTFFLTLLTPVTFGVSLLIGYFFGRAAVELAKEKGQPLGARRWLTYPAILAVCLPLFLAVTLWPIPAAGIEAGEQIRHARHWEAENWKVRVTRMEKQPGPAPGTTKWVTVQSLEPMSAEQRAEYEGTLNLVRKMPVSIGSQDTTLQLFCIVGALAAWWTMLGLIYWAFPKWPTTLFHPLLDGYDYLHGVRLAACAGLALFVWSGFAFRLWDAAHGG